MIAIMTCSTQTTVMPRPGRAAIAAIMSRTSGGVSPAITSSSSNSDGSVASARATSNFFSSPTVRFADRCIAR